MIYDRINADFAVKKEKEKKERPFCHKTFSRRCLKQS